MMKLFLLCHDGVLRLGKSVLVLYYNALKLGNVCENLNSRAMRTFEYWMERTCTSWKQAFTYDVNKFVFTAKRAEIFIEACCNSVML